MKITATYGPARNPKIMALSFIAAGMMTFMLVAQLFGYEDFAIILSGVLPTNDTRELAIASGMIVMIELVALPYLLRMYISTLMRVLSAVCAFMVSGFWLLTMLTNAHAANSGMFASTLELPGGILAALWAATLFGLICVVTFTDSRFRHAGS